MSHALEAGARASHGRLENNAIIDMMLAADAELNDKIGRPRAILFDLDGILVDSTAVVLQEWKRWAAERGVPVERLLERAHGRRTEDLLRELVPEVDAGAEARLIEERERLAVDGMRAFPGAAELTADPPAEKWAIATSGGRELALGRLGAAGLPVPGVLVTADDVSAGKPDPQCWLLAATGLKVPAGECIVIEDSPAGIEAAKRAGMTAIGVGTTHPAELLSGADLVVGDLLEAEAALRALFPRAG